MRCYLNIVNEILSNGQWQENRTGIRTLALPNIIFSHNMEQGYPLLTTKKMPFKSMCVELNGFIQGITSKKWYYDNGCKYWQEWGNPYEVKRRLLEDFNTVEVSDEIRKKYQLEEDSLGTAYPWQWRRFGEVHDENDNGVLNGHDQLKDLVNKLHNNPNDRRMVVSSWCPNQLSRCALPPCHFVFNVVVINDVLSLWFGMRSVDIPLGLPVNIAFYGLLLLLLCKEGNFKPGNLTAMLGNAHIYENQIDGIKEQLKRSPRQLPTLSIMKNNSVGFSIFDWTYKDVKLINYNPHKTIRMPIAV